MITEALQAIFSIWFLIGAALVFFMQAGFAMVEAGFTRAKNAGNIIMKNTMDFCLGTIAFLILGYSLLCGDGGNSFIGWGGHPLTDFCRNRLVNIYIQPGVLCHSRNNCFWCDGRKNKIYFLLYLQLYYFTDYLSNRSTLGLGSRWFLNCNGIPRFCRKRSYSLCRWFICF